MHQFRIDNGMGGLTKALLSLRRDSDGCGKRYPRYSTDGTGVWHHHQYTRYRNTTPTSSVKPHLYLLLYG